MCMDIQDSEKMGDRSLDDEVQIIEVHIEKANQVTVKQEKRPDDAEIAELAAKLVEANKAKMGSIQNQQQQQQTVAQQRQAGVLQGQSNLTGLLGYFTNNRRASDTAKVASTTTSTTTTTATTTTTSTNAVEGRVPLDDESQRGRFGWSTFGDTHVPYILRAGEKFCVVRILESKLLNKYLTCLHPDIYSCTNIRSYYITEAESKLLNEINAKHCEGQFGRDQFTVRDLVVRMADARDFYTFLDVCYTKLNPGATPVSGHKVDKCGFIRINKESVVPYTVKDGLKYVPLFYFEGETDNLKLKADQLEGWDLAYLKFCCKAQGIRNELFAHETCSVISLSDIKSYFPPGTNFEDYWPSKVIDLLVMPNKSGVGGGSGCGGGWTKQPATPPIVRSGTVQSNAGQKAPSASINARTGPVQSVLPRGTTIAGNVINSTIQRTGAQARTHTAPTIVSASRNNSVTQPMMNTVQATVNGWSGLVGGQPAFQTLVSQANSIIRMPNSPLSMHNQIPGKSYSVQSRSRGGGGGTTAYPVYPVSTMQNAVHVQPPPLVRATAHSSQPNLGVSATYTTPSLQNVVNASTYPQMLGLSAEQVQALMPQQAAGATLLPHSQRHTPPHNASHVKYPPPLVSVNNSSSSSNSNSNNSNNNSSNSCRDSRGRKPLIPIGEIHPSVGCQVQPFQVQKALVEDKFVFCINFKPYVYTELLMTLPDFVSEYFPNCDISSCRQVLTEVLSVDLYQGNRLQMEMLQKAGKCSSLNEELPLIQVQSIMKYMRQLKYMLDNRNMAMPTHSSEEHQKKRKHTS